MGRIPHKKPDNASRQKAAHAALVAFVHRKELCLSPHTAPKLLEDDLEGYFTDLLTDLMHLADARGIDFNARLLTARDQHDEEKGA